ncbi:5'-methylthioadenosine/adenosylhomocysteine nucleosidase [Konateibacter massiliensis]|uniref:5'-methylthioadenosine/adenosylhomocysteine nucleosidase n=1 Tax=Konateibacter massiliensis TaxID=2002841 RepID=UPI000C1622E5|nr:5'-methylthioadenosine/adenosylhomocysteine nucleosidase [Konateibacter massiliensis]
MSVTGIIGAMEEEVNILKDKMQVTEIVKKASMEFYKGTLNGKEVVIVRSGISKVNAAVCTQILVDDFGICRVINTGIAGSLQNKIDIGDIVISSDAMQHDVDATGFGYELGVIPRMETSTFIADKELIDLAKKVCEREIPDITAHIGRVVTGDQFISDKGVKDRIENNFHGYCTEMEGAAIAQTAYLNQIPFVILRAISDKADDSATVDYPTFEKKAIEHSVILVENMLKEL